MNNKVDGETREHFRDWLRERLRAGEFYNRRGKHYLIREFAKYCRERGAPIDEASLGRYVNREEEGQGAPVLPTPERCRALAKVFGLPAVRVLAHAGYITGADFGEGLALNLADLTPDTLADTLLTLMQSAQEGQGEGEEAS